MGCTRESERIQASFGLVESVHPQFENDVDLEAGGVLLALPSLLVNGLLKFSGQNFELPSGYYGLDSLLIILAFMALLRIKSLESLRYYDPGELGKLVGLDRAPEVKTFRQKILFLSTYGDVVNFCRQLCISWMEDEPDLAGILYVDGHVRVYHGEQTKLPKRYVAREKLCLRGMTDYWINDAVGQPFFVVSHAFNRGLLGTLRDDIVPRLLTDIPNQPGHDELLEDNFLYRFSLIFDREGYSPDFFKEMWQKRIACYTYRKYAKTEWREEEFVKTKVVFPNGETETMKLAERGIYFQKPKIWLRQIRKLTTTGHQTALVTTDYKNEAAIIAGRMFSRWSQENFFKYMMQHYGIDRLISYDLEICDDPIQVVNPQYRLLEGRIRSESSKLSRKKAEYGALILEEEMNDENIKKYVKKKAELKENIENLQTEVDSLKSEKKQTKKHILFTELPEGEKFQTFKTKGKQFMDAIKMIAYRAETAMASILKLHMPKKDEARPLVRQIFMTEADIFPDPDAGELRVTIHNMANPRNNQYVEKLCRTLNESDTHFPGTDLRLVYNLVSTQNHPGQEV